MLNFLYCVYIVLCKGCYHRLEGVHILGMATFFSDDGIFGTAWGGAQTAHPPPCSKQKPDLMPTVLPSQMARKMEIRTIALKMPCILQFTSKPKWSSDTLKKLRYEPKNSRISDLQIQLKISMPPFSPMEYFHCLNLLILLFILLVK